MPQKGERITAVHLTVIFRENKGISMRWKELNPKMIERGIKHNYTSVSDNLKYLVEQGTIVRYEWNKNPRYGMPDTRPNGSKFIIVKNPNLPDEIVELGK